MNPKKYKINSIQSIDKNKNQIFINLQKDYKIKQRKLNKNGKFKKTLNFSRVKMR